MRRSAFTWGGWRAWLAVPTLVLAALILAGCEKPPAADLDAARTALDAARAASSGRWALPELAHAEALFDGVNSEMSQESGRFFQFMRSYARVKALLAAARADAEGAVDAARREREEAKKEAGDAGRRARTMLEGARAAAQIAPSPRSGKADLDRLRAELHAVEMELPDVDRLIASEEFRLAAKKGSDLASRVETALSRFFGRMEHGNLGSATIDRGAPAWCHETREALSLPRVRMSEGRPT